MAGLTENSRTLTGALAFRALEEQIKGEAKPDRVFTDPCYARLSDAVQSLDDGRPHAPSPLDLAVLARHVMRSYELQTSPGTPIHFWARRGPGWPNPEQWNAVGANARAENGGFSVRALPWRPAWLSDISAAGVDAGPASGRSLRENVRVPGDPFMQLRFGRDSYLTPGQRAAVRTAFSTSPGSTLIICLPTGDGKSFVFQSVASVGYGNQDGVAGVTLVVTPTVSLALDHQRAAAETGLFPFPTAYVSGMSEADHQLIRNRIVQGTQGLCFAAPESVCGSLKEPLLDAAQAGLLRAIVVDEAHLVDAWGTNFRPSFQLVSGLRKELLDIAPSDLAPRTLLMSATITDETVTTLRTLFPGHLSGSTDVELLSAAQLRPEIEYWVADPVHQSERDRRVLEAIFHMPRPAILYVTRVEEAERWYNDLGNRGFKRLGVMTGRSSPSERDKLIEEWRAQTLDLVVGTSAFGLGIDNQHVRTVIHACVPETLDRFYQEVGRGGRDGLASASIIVPYRAEHESYWDRDDFRMARSLNQRRLISVERGLERWRGMFYHRDTTHEGDGVFQLRVDGAPGSGPTDIDMVGTSNTEWNVRTLTLMANAGLVELLGPAAQSITAEETLGHYQRLKTLDPSHLHPDTWANLVEPQRKRMADANRRNLRQMDRFLLRQECAADVLAPVYELIWPPSTSDATSSVTVAAACGGCPYCRSVQSSRVAAVSVMHDYSATPTTRVSFPASDLLDNNWRVVIFYNPDINRRQLRRWTQALGRLAGCGVRNFILLTGAPVDLVDVQQSRGDTVIFSSNRLPPKDDLPPGPVAMIAPVGGSLPERVLRPRNPSAAHFIFMDSRTQYPDMPGVRFGDRFEGAQLDLDLFIDRMSQ